jgi:hypothetical protein
MEIEEILGYFDISREDINYLMKVAEYSGKGEYELIKSYIELGMNAQKMADDMKRKFPNAEFEKKLIITPKNDFDKYELPKKMAAVFIY